MRAGILDRRVVIESYTTAQDEVGEPVKSYTTLDTVWAQVRPLRGQERFVAQQEYAEVTTRFRLRHRTDIDEKMRLVYGGDEYDIVAILEIGRREGLEILAKASVP
jgi:SPP1 family predicted phage head-tail adaptor